MSKRMDVMGSVTSRNGSVRGTRLEMMVISVEEMTGASRARAMRDSLAVLS
ncbi:MAG: hypothetical protein ACI8T1_000332 [Verrucomicrobiales bacterium]|jgi:hypothetical protein